MEDSRNTRWLLIVIILIALLFRMWSIHFGLPYLYHPDEPGYVTIAQDILKTGDLNPHFFNYPSLFFYILTLAYIPYYGIGKLTGIISSLADIPAPIMLAGAVGKTALPATFLLGRILTAAFGAAAVALVFIIGTALTKNSKVSLLSAFLMAISPSHVLHSHYITPDAYLVFFVLLAFWGSIQVFQYGKTWHYAIAGVASGLVASTKYNGSLIILTLISAHFLRYGMKGFREYRLYLALAMSGVAFFATTPFALLDHQKFLSDLRYEAHHYSTGHPGAEGAALSFYLSYLLRIEGPLIFLAFFEIVRGIYSRSKETILATTFPLVYFIFINSFVVRNDRTILPIVPFLIILASIFLIYLFREVIAVRVNSRTYLNLIVGAVTALFVIWPLVNSVKRDVRLSTVDSRETARIWIDHNLPEGARIAVESYSPYVDPQRFLVQGFGKMIDHSPEWYISNGFTYLVFSQGMFARYYNNPVQYASEISHYEKLFQTFNMVKTFQDGGYEIRVYQIN